MNTLADAAFLTASEPHAQGAVGYPDQSLRGMGAITTNAGPTILISPQSVALNGEMTPSVMSMPPPRGYMGTPQQLTAAPGRHLQILDHTVHRIDNLVKPSGEEEKEMVVSNLRHFTLKVGVLDPRLGMGRDAELPLKAELLYENGTLVEQLATCEPLLVGKTEVVAMQGTALFKLRITSLSSHRDKQARAQRRRLPRPLRASPPYFPVALTSPRPPPPP